MVDRVHGKTRHAPIELDWKALEQKGVVQLTDGTAVAGLHGVDANVPSNRLLTSNWPPPEACGPGPFAPSDRADPAVSMSMRPGCAGPWQASAANPAKTTRILACMRGSSIGARYGRGGAGVLNGRRALERAARDGAEAKGMNRVQ